MNLASFNKGLEKEMEGLLMEFAKDAAKKLAKQQQEQQSADLKAKMKENEAGFHTTTFQECHESFIKLYESASDTGSTVASSAGALEAKARGEAGAPQEAHDKEEDLESQLGGKVDFGALFLPGFGPTPNKINK